jgi:hypothetical protein
MQDDSSFEYDPDLSIHSEPHLRIDTTNWPGNNAAPRLVSPPTNDENIENENHDAELLISSDSFPLLSNSSIKNKKELEALLLEIFRLQKGNSKKAQKFVLRVRNGHDITLCQIPKSQNLKYFKRCVHDAGWLDNVLDACVSEDINREDARQWLSYTLGRKHPKSFEWAAEKLGYGVAFTKKQMDAETAAAMWKDAGVTLRGQRVIRRFMKSYFGHYFTVPEAHIKGLVSSFVQPIHGVAEVNTLKITYWYKPIDEVILNLLVTEWAKVDFASLEIIIGGDHGQLKFGECIKVILYDENRNVIDSVTEKVGHIDCTKDTYHILKATIAEDLNESLKRVVGKSIQICRGDNDVSFAFVDPNVEILEGEIRCPVKALHIGDIAYLAMMLGRVNMEGKWCCFCDLSPAEWSKRGHRKGIPWTLNRMKAIREKLASGELRDIPANRRGCVADPLMDALDIVDFILPILHAMMGMFNDSFEHGLMRYIDERHEKIGPEETKAREEFWGANIEKGKMEEAFDEWLTEKEEYEIGLKCEIKAYEEKKKLRRPVKRGNKKTINSFVYTRDERKEMDVLIKEWKNDVKALQQNHDNRVHDLAQVELEWKRKKAALKEVRSTRKKLDCQVRQDCDETLKSNGVDRGASHGGDFTGVTILVLEDRLDAIMEDLHQHLLSNPDNDVPEEEINAVFDSYQVHFRLMSKMFSLARTPKSELADPVKKEALLVELSQTIGLVMTSWERLGLSLTTVKRHILQSHLVEQIDEHDGIGEYIEDWVEKMHQFVKLMNSRGKIRNLQTKAAYHCRMEKLAHNRKVQEAGNEVYKATKRKFKTERNKKKAAQLRKEERDKRREEAVKFAPVLFEKEQPSGFEYNLREYKKVINEESSPSEASDQSEESSSTDGSEGTSSSDES